MCNWCDLFNICLLHYMAPCPKTWVSPLTFEDSGISTEDFVAQLGRAGELSIVSRLDYPTSGLLPLAVGVESPADHWLRAQFAGRLVWKEYVCLCQGPTLGEVGIQGVDLDEHVFVSLREIGHWPCDGHGIFGKIHRLRCFWLHLVTLRGKISTLLQNVQIDDGTWQSEIYEEGSTASVISGAAMEALTLFEVAERYYLPNADFVGRSELIYLKVWPKTGRRHQIRVHLASLGRPLVGDLTYGKAHSFDSFDAGRLFLHCRAISFRDLQGHRFQVQAPIPLELEKMLEMLEPLVKGKKAVCMEEVRHQASAELKLFESRRGTGLSNFIGHVTCRGVSEAAKHFLSPRAVDS